MSDVTMRDGVLVDTGDDERPHLVGTTSNNIAT